MFKRHDLVVGVLAFTIGSGSAVAAAQLTTIGADGVIHACVQVNGVLRAIEADETCKTGREGANETAISWNVAGAVGATGPAGPTGPTGATGPQGIPGPKGDTGAAGSFSGSFSSPNGLYSISVTDAGIVFRGPNARVTLDANGATVDASALSANVAGNTTLRTGGSMTMNVGGNYTGNYSGATSENYAGNYTGNYTGNYSGNYSGNYTGNYGGNYSGNYSGNYTASVDQSATVQIGGNLNIEVAGNTSIDSGDSASYESVGPTTIRGSVVNIN